MAGRMSLFLVKPVRYLIADAHMQLSPCMIHCGALIRSHIVSSYESCYSLALRSLMSDNIDLSAHQAFRIDLALRGCKRQACTHLWAESRRKASRKSRLFCRDVEQLIAEEERQRKRLTGQWCCSLECIALAIGSN